MVYHSFTEPQKAYLLQLGGSNEQFINESNGKPLRPRNHWTTATNLFNSKFSTDLSKHSIKAAYKKTKNQESTAKKKIKRVRVNGSMYCDALKNTIKAAIENNPELSYTEQHAILSRSITISKSQFKKIAKLLGFNSYKAGKCQKLEQFDRDRRLSFCQQIQPIIDDVMVNTWFSDESRFYGLGIK